MRKTEAVKLLSLMGFFFSLQATILCIVLIWVSESDILGP